MINASDFGLQQNPFRTLVTDEATKHWAGMPETKQRLEEIVISVLPEDIGASEFVIMYGSYGGGKTHALRYFARKIDEEHYGYAFYVGKVRLGPKPSFLELFGSIVKENREMLPGLVQHVKESVTKEMRLAREARKYSDVLDDSVFLQKIIEDTVPSANNALVVKFMEEVSQEKVESSVVSLLTGRDVGDDYSAAGMMASLIGVMTSPIGEQPARYKAAYVFFDEVEDMLNLKYADLFTFWGACRELVNRTAESHCAIVLAFSIGGAQLESQIETFLIERLTRPFFEMKQLTDEDAKKFVKDYLQSVRLDAANPPHPFFPFSEEAIDFILERDPEIVPRHILRDMRRVFERAARREKVARGEEISREIAEEILSEMGV